MAVVRIVPEAVYDERDVIILLGFTAEQLSRARREGLEYKELTRGRRVYFGQKLIDWFMRPAAAASAE